MNFLERENITAQNQPLAEELLLRPSRYWLSNVAHFLANRIPEKRKNIFRRICNLYMRGYTGKGAYHPQKLTTGEREKLLHLLQHPLVATSVQKIVDILEIASQREIKKTPEEIASTIKLALSLFGTSNIPPARAPLEDLKLFSKQYNFHYLIDTQGKKAYISFNELERIAELIEFESGTTRLRQIFIGILKALSDQKYEIIDISSH